jgi:uncharacterized phage protein (TIGR01671 family)
MREIKFRAWDKVDSKMRKVNMLNTYDGSPRNQTLYFLEATSDNNGFRRLPDCELMQYTGLKDCKRTEKHPEGQEIYEGDILLITEEPGSEYEEKYKTVVKYDGGAFVVEVNGEDYDFTAIGWSLTKWDNEVSTCEVIGNIYENPELLKEEQ